MQDKYIPATDISVGMIVLAHVARGSGHEIPFAQPHRITKFTKNGGHIQVTATGPDGSDAILYVDSRHLFSIAS